MTLSKQLRRSGFLVLAIFSTATMIGCGGGEEAATEADSSAASGDTSSTASPMPAMDPNQGGEGDGSSGQGMSPSMSSGPGMSSMSGPGMSGPGMSAPGMSAPGMDGGEMSSMAEGYANGYPGGGAGGQGAAKPQRPSSFDAWTDDDFLAAAREHDPKVLDAIDFKVKSAPGDAGVAVLLTSLLDLPPLPTPTTPIGGANSYPGMEEGDSPYPGSPNPGAASSGTPMVPPGSNSAPSSNSIQGSGRSLGIPAAPPQSSLTEPVDKNLQNIAAGSGAAVDSVSAMILEAAVTFMPQGAAVGAIAGGAQGRMQGLTSQPPATGSSPPDYSQPPANSENSMPPGYPGGGSYPGGSGYPGGNPQDGIGGQRTGQLKDRQLVEKVVDGLIVNNSKDAWQAIFGIVAGTVKTPIPASANCEIVVERLVYNMDSNADVIQPVILAFLDKATPIPPESRSACIRMLSAISATQTDKLTGFASAATPTVVLDGANGFSGGEGMGEPGSSAPGGYPGMNAAGMGGPAGYPGMNGPDGGAAPARQSSLPVVSIDSEIAARGANFLWSPKVISTIVGQLEKATDLTGASDVLLLASTIPGAEVRHAICETFARLHEEGADQLNASGLFSDVRDPAMLVILKALPRTRPSKDNAGTLDSWSEGTRSLVLALRDELKRTSPHLKKYTDALPVRLHKNATAEVSVIVQFPLATDEQPKDALPSMTQVYYTRTSFTPQRIHDGEDLIKHYESKTSGFDRPDEAKGVRWIEGVKTLQNGHRRTMDVIIQQGGAGGVNGQMGFGGGGAESGFGGGGGAAGGSFSVEIIVVETVDPKNALPATTQVSARE